MPIVIVVQKITIFAVKYLQVGRVRVHRVLVDTELGTKVSFGGVLDSSSDLGEVKVSYLIRLLKLKWL